MKDEKNRATEAEKAFAKEMFDFLQGLIDCEGHLPEDDEEENDDE